MAINKIFLDSNFLVALNNPNDNSHQKAILFAEKLKNEDITPYISNFIFLEVVTILAQKVGRKTAKTAGENLKQIPNLIFVDEDLEEESWKVFKSITKKNFSFVDSSILAILKSERINYLLTFDTTDFKSLQKQYNFSLYDLAN